MPKPQIVLEMHSLSLTEVKFFIYLFFYFSIFLNKNTPGYPLVFQCHAICYLYIYIYIQIYRDDILSLILTLLQKQFLH